MGFSNGNNLWVIMINIISLEVKEEIFFLGQNNNNCK